MMHTNTLILSLALAALTAGGRGMAQAPALAEAPLTLDGAIRLGLANQQQIGASMSQSEAARARVSQARSAYYPYVAPNFQYSRQMTAFNAGQGTRTGTITQKVTSIGLTQTIFDSGKREINVARSKDSARSAEYNLQDTRQSVIESVSTAWYDLLRTKDLVRVAESGVTRAKATLDATQAFVEAGSSPRKDILQAQADYDNARVQEIQARNSVRLAETSLKNAIGITSLPPIAPEASQVATPAETPDASTVADYINKAMAARPDLKATEAGISSNRRSVRLANIEAGPQLQSDFNEGYRVDPDPGESRSITATISYPLFDAGAARARVREARANLKQSEQLLELTRQNIAATVESAYLQRDEARERLGATRTAEAAARENFTSATESQKEGVGTILDVITAQNQLVTAETNAVQAIYDYYTADARLQRAIGANDPYAKESRSS